MSLFTRAVLVMGLFTGLASIALAGSFTFTTIDYPGATDTWVTGINDSGQIVGYYLGGNGVYNGFLDSGGVFSTITDPSAPTSSGSGTFAAGISNAGQIVGYYGVGGYGNGAATGFVYSGGTFTTINGQPTPEFYALGINDSGQIVGNTSFGGFSDNGGTFTQLTVPASAYTLVSGINDSSQIVGYDITGGEPSGFLDSGGTYTTLNLGTLATGINASGQIVGYETGNYGGFLYSGGTYTSIAFPGADTANDVATGINDSGQIVGYYAIGNGGLQGYLATPTSSSSPEPATLAMAFAAFLGMACHHTRKRLLRS